MNYFGDQCHFLTLEVKNDHRSCFVVLGAILIGWK